MTPVTFHTSPTSLAHQRFEGLTSVKCTTVFNRMQAVPAPSRKMIFLSVQKILIILHRDSKQETYMLS